MSGTISNLEIKDSTITITGNRWFVGFFAGRTAAATSLVVNCTSTNNRLVVDGAVTELRFSKKNIFFFIFIFILINFFLLIFFILINFFFKKIVGGIVGNFQSGAIDNCVTSYLRFEDYTTTTITYVGANLGSVESGTVQNIYAYRNNFYFGKFLFFILFSVLCIKKKLFYFI